jgi:glucokinase
MTMWLPPPPYLLGPDDAAELHPGPRIEANLRPAGARHGLGQAYLLLDEHGRCYPFPSEGAT